MLSPSPGMPGVLGRSWYGKQGLLEAWCLCLPVLLWGMRAGSGKEDLRTQQASLAFSVLVQTDIVIWGTPSFMKTRARVSPHYFSNSLQPFPIFAYFAEDAWKVGHLLSRYTSLWSASRRQIKGGDEHHQWMLRVTPSASWVCRKVIANSDLGPDATGSSFKCLQSYFLANSSIPTMSLLDSSSLAFSSFLLRYWSSEI